MFCFILLYSFCSMLLQFFLHKLSVTEVIWPREFLNCQKFTVPFLKKITNTSQEHKFWSSFFFFFYIFSWFYLINLIPYTYPHVFPSNLTKWLQHISCKLHYFVTVQAHLTFQAGYIGTGTGGKPCGFKRLGVGPIVGGTMFSGRRGRNPQGHYGA